jgi:hypothetical protein
MADVLRIKRRLTGSPGAPPSLANAEIAYNEVDHILYYGEGTGGSGGSATVVVGIAGQGLASAATPTMNGAAAVGVATSWSRGDHVHPSDTSRAPTVSPTFTGTVTMSGATSVVAPTVTPATDNSTKVATTAFVQSAIGAVSSGVTSIAGANGISASAPSGAVTVSIAPTADVAWSSHRITGLLDPSNPQDAATKNYVDSVAQGVDAKASVRLATTTNLAALSGLIAVDGTTVVAGDRVLVKDQTTQSANGIYVAASGAWTRALDADTWAELPAAFVFVEEGATNADNGYVCTVTAGGTLGTTPITWVQFSGAGQVNAGAGLTKTGNSIDAVGTANRIQVNADNIDIAATYAGQSSISTLGTIATGTWNGATIAVAYGGTGATSLTGYVKGAGTAALTGVASIPSTDISGLGTMSVQNANAVAITGGTIDGVTFDCGTF